MNEHTKEWAEEGNWVVKEIKNQESKESTKPRGDFKEKPMRTKETHWVGQWLFVSWEERVGGDEEINYVGPQQLMRQGRFWRGASHCGNSHSLP